MINLIYSLASERVMCNKNLILCIFFHLLQHFIINAVPYQLNKMDLHIIRCLYNILNKRLT